MRTSLLDHGYIELIETWGSDERIIEAARMSTGKGFLGWGPTFKCDTCDMPITDVGEPAGKPCPRCVRMNKPGSIKAIPGDEKLLRFLYENKHSTPFEMAGATFEVKAPIFAIREWHRHRVPFSYNEMSARYTPLPDENYIPTVERLMMQGGANKQAQGMGAALTRDGAEKFRRRLVTAYTEQQDIYETALSMGVPKELARIHLPVGRYSRMRASANLRGWLNFMTLRCAPNAQYEIRVYADALGNMLAEKFPRTLQLWGKETFG